MTTGWVWRMWGFSPLEQPLLKLPLSIPHGNSRQRPAVCLTWSQKSLDSPHEAEFGDSDVDALDTDEERSDWQAVGTREGVSTSSRSASTHGGLVSSIDNPHQARAHFANSSDATIHTHSSGSDRTGGSLSVVTVGPEGNVHAATPAQGMKGGASWVARANVSRFDIVPNGWHFF